ncbi:helix-turn-helix transcriptional regulator [Flavisolibacter sp. BT320]|nr:helix-turn-helix transcriptional regulator [Flavisolibacter longurius]
MTFYQKHIQRIQRVHYSNKTQIETVVGTRHYINNNLDKPLNLDLLSNVHFTSKFHLLRLYKKYYGQTPMQYLTEKRMEKAKELLQTGMTVSDTCYEVGFESPCSFSTLFKSRTGLTPAAYKKAIFAKVNPQ